MNRRLPALTANEVIRALERAGFTVRECRAAIAGWCIQTIPNAR